MPSNDPEFERWVEEARATPISALFAHSRMPALKGATDKCGPCPRCNDGVDRFSINTTKNVFNCRWCGGGNVVDLCMALENCDFLSACEVLTRRPPPGRVKRETPEERERRERDTQAWREEIARRNAEQIATAQAYREAERRRCWRFWTKAGPVPGSAVERYLAHRGLEMPDGAHLRSLYRHPLFDQPGKGVKPVHVGPAMVAAIIGPDGRFAGLHATWIDLSTEDGKALVPDRKTGDFVPAKKVRGSQRGGRIELVRVPNPRRLFTGEGIETVLSVWRALRVARSPLLEGAAFWSAVNLDNLGGKALGRVAHPTLRRVDKTGRSYSLLVRDAEPDPGSIVMPVPDSVDELFLLGDGDSDPFNTNNALLRAARRHARPGRTIRIAWADTGLDFNTMLRGQAA